MTRYAGHAVGLRIHATSHTAAGTVLDVDDFALGGG
jgi:hypothetical protein